MTRPKIRISTLMLLVVIAALAVALVVERRKSAAFRAEVYGDRDVRRMIRWRAETLHEKIIEWPRPYGLEPAVFSELVAAIAAEDLGGVPVEEVEADLAAIAEGMTGPVDFSDASAAYVVHRREKKRSRAEAVESARSGLRLKSAADAIEKAAAK